MYRLSLCILDSNVDYYFKFYSTCVYLYLCTDKALAGFPCREASCLPTVTIGLCFVGVYIRLTVFRENR